MNHILVNDNLQTLNKKLTEENQQLTLKVYSLQKQLENAGLQISHISKLQDQIKQMETEILKLRRDNVNLLELVSENQQTPRKDVENQKELYEQKLHLILRENKRLFKINKELQNKQANNLESFASKLFEVSLELRNKLENMENIQHSNPTMTSPKGLSKKIYEDLIQQLTNTNTETKPLRATQTKRFPTIGRDTKQLNTQMNISIVSSNYK